MIIATPTDSMSPVHDTPEDAGRQPEPGLALCLSGGGYRAMVFPRLRATNCSETTPKTGLPYPEKVMS